MEKKKNDPGYFDLERPADLQALRNPDLILPKLESLIIIDDLLGKSIYE